MSQPALWFTDADLKTNRQGFINLMQALNLTIRGLLEFVGSSGICLVATAAGVSNLLTYLNLRDIGRISISFILTLIFGLGSVYIVPRSVNNSWKLLQDIAKGTVRSTKGKLTLVEEGTGHGTLYTLSIKDVELQFPRRAVPIIKSLKTVRVYYTPKSKILLSLEEC